MAQVRQAAVALALGVAASAAMAQGTVWKCTDADGRPHYTNVKDEAKSPSCKIVSETKVSTVPASAIPVAARGNAAATPTPATFPRVDANTQKARDDSRRKILEDELATEQRSLTDARSKLGEPASANNEAVRKPLVETVERHERNIAALQREIGNLK
jgi:hypothetical protein